MIGVTTSWNDKAIIQQNRLTDDSRGTQIVGDYILYGGTLYWWVGSAGHASWHPSPAQNFEVAVGFLKNLWTSGQWHRTATSNKFRALSLIKLLGAIKKSQVL